ncbi:type II toxin-antitoxin system VapC family toxin [Rhizobium sp. PL01]|uniref:type II toxin-antitoxin system VapC family toxin n=1 Tax=Rhizobium sp. PL01 TaxID=3085631 RepID=UPI002982270D|nr:PIN domain-containing protein [Rhizobium sp. PL01]MDW5315520.1 PIN domain-containing protein [Rhizobium sp. PL01]
MIVVDTNFLILMIDPDSTQNTNRRADRVRHFVGALAKTNTVIMIPAPSIAELVAGRAERIEEIVETVRRLKGFTVQPFDEVIAIETGERIAHWQDSIPPADRAPGWKVAMKYDAMIASTAIVRGASEVYTTDTGLGQYLEGSSVVAKLIDELPLPPEDPQQQFPWE